MPLSILPERKQILVVDDEPNLRRVLSAQLERDGYDVHTAEDGEQALLILKENHLDLVITDLRMPKVDGMELLRRALELDDELPVVMITAHGTVDNAVEALKTGAFDYLTNPFDQAEVRAIVRKALRTRDLSAAEATRPESDAREVARYGIIGQSASILELYAVLDRVADTPTTVLITGESGTGKELVARALHENSSRRDKPFIKVNCAAIPKRSDGERAVRGTSARRLHRSRRFEAGALSELASGGTLFLDEIGYRFPWGNAGEIAARAAGERVRTRRRREDHSSRRAARRGDQQRPQTRDRRRRLSRGPVLPLERRAHAPARRSANARRTSRSLVKHFIDKFNARLKKNVARGLEADTEERTSLRIRGRVTYRRARERARSSARSCSPTAASSRFSTCPRKCGTLRRPSRRRPRCKQGPIPRWPPPTASKSRSRQR